MEVRVIHRVSKNYFLFKFKPKKPTLIPKDNVYSPEKVFIRKNTPFNSRLNTGFFSVFATLIIHQTHLITEKIKERTKSYLIKWN